HLTDPPARAEDKRRDITGIGRQQADPFVSFEIVRRSRRGEAAEIVRAGEGSPVERREASFDQRTVAQVAGPQDAVEAFPDYVQWLVGFAQVQPDIGILLPKA